MYYIIVRPSWRVRREYLRLKKIKKKKSPIRVRKSIGMGFFSEHENTCFVIITPVKTLDNMLMCSKLIFFSDQSETFKRIRVYDNVRILQSVGIHFNPPRLYQTHYAVFVP